MSRLILGNEQATALINLGYNMKNIFSFTLVFLFYSYSSSAFNNSHGVTNYEMEYSYFPLHDASNKELFYPGSLAIIPEDGRTIFYEAFERAKREIRIEICVLEDPLILQSINQALHRGITVRVTVDNGKYQTTPSERANLAQYLTSAGGHLHLSNPIFPRSFPKVILIDDQYAIVGTACLDTTTFLQYRDYAYVSDDQCVIDTLSLLFENDWLYSAPVGFPFPPYNPTPPNADPNIIIAPVNAMDRLVSFIQGARETLDITSELLGNATLESELAKAIERHVRVRLIAPQFVNNATPAEQVLQIASLTKLKAAGIDVHVTKPPESAQKPYMHARTAIADGCKVYLGSVSLSPNSATFNREVGLILHNRYLVQKMSRRFDLDFLFKSVSF